MSQVAVVSGADRGLGLALCEILLKKGLRVFAGQFMPQWPDLSMLREKYPDALTIIPLDVSDTESVKNAARLVKESVGNVDILINNAAIGGREGDIREGLDFSIPLKIYNTNSLGPIRMAEAFLPLMQKGMKRLCFVSSEAGSVGVCTRDSLFGYCMSKTALNMAIKIMFNDLFPKGFTFRIYHPGWLRSYMTGQKNTNGLFEPEESAEVAVEQFLGHFAVEDQLTMLDIHGQAWPF